MRPFRTRPIVPALAAVLVSLSLSFGCSPPGPAAQDASTPRLEGQRLSGTPPEGEAERGGSEGKILSASIPARDVRGEAVPGLPRPPGSVRADYSEREADGLALVRTSYLTRERANAVLGFYRGVFSAKGWQVANVEYSGDGWRFLVLRGDLEAQVKVSPRDGGSEVGIELSGPGVESASGAGSGGPQDSSASTGGSKR